MAEAPPPRTPEHAEADAADARQVPTRPSAVELDGLLGPAGPLARALPGYAPREGQAAMMHAVLETLEDRGVLLVEAGTGVGKSLGYLLPAALSGQRVVVSTATKALQEQLVSRDVPLVARAVAEVRETPFRAALLKGRTNYLCREALDEALADPELAHALRSELDAVADWATRTARGDRAELEALADGAPVWGLVSMSAEGCHGQRCRHFDACFVMKARREAASADVVVVNHHLYFADLGLRATSGVQLLPDVDAVVFDEAHHVEDVAATHFGATVSDARLDVLCRDALKRLRALGDPMERPEALAARVRDAARTLFDRLRREGSRVRLAPGALPPDVQDAYMALDTALGGLQVQLGDAAGVGDGADPGLRRLATRTHDVRETLYRLVQTDDPGRVTWIERGPRATFLREAPIDLRGPLADHLYATVPALVFTSATLTVDGDFAHTRERLGLTDPGLAATAPAAEPAFDAEFDPLGPPGEPLGAFDDAMASLVAQARELIAPSPFDFARQALLYIADDLPDPRAPDRLEAAEARVRQLVDLTDGGAFVLCTSVATMRALHGRLRAAFAGAPTPRTLLLQGQGSKASLLRRFREDGHAVLVATATFWEGVDVVGPALRLVVIDKLPFASPGDPLTAARLDALERQGGQPFRDYSLPRAVLTLKQGFGRLVRSRSDHGLVAVLDPRLTRAGYGRRFLRSLPPARRVADLGALRAAWAELLDRTDEAKNDTPRATDEGDRGTS